MVWRLHHPNDEALTIMAPLTLSFHTGKPLGFFLTQIIQALYSQQCSWMSLKRYTDPTVTETILNYGQTHGGKHWELPTPGLLPLHILTTHPRAGSKKTLKGKSFPHNNFDKSHSIRREWKDLSGSKSVSWTSSLIKSLLWYWIKMHSVCEKAATFSQSLLRSQHVLKTRTPWIKTAHPSCRQTAMALCPRNLLNAMLHCNRELKFFPYVSSLNDGKI